MAYYEINPNLSFNLLFLDSQIDLDFSKNKCACYILFLLAWIMFFTSNWKPCGLIQWREALLMISSPGAEVIPYLCGGPAGHTGPRPAGRQPVNHPEGAGFRPQHRWGYVQTEGHAVMSPCGDRKTLVNSPRRWRLQKANISRKCEN